MKKEDLIRFIKGSGNSDFQQSVINWVESSPENRRFYNQVKAEYVSEFNSDSNLDVEKEFDKFLNEKNKNHSSSYFLNKIASIIIIALLIGGGWFIVNESDNLNETIVFYEASPKSIKEVALPDGSIVLLNSASTIKVSGDFNQKTRKIYLEGEAFFKVAEDKTRPFIVRTNSDLQIRVLGTSFNVKAYDSDSTIETTLVSGKVELQNSTKNKTLFALSPNEMATYNKLANKLDVNQVRTAIVTSWKEGLLIFDNEPIQNVLNSLERHYDVKIKINDSEIRTYTFSGKIEPKANIQEVLKLIEASSPIKSTYNEQENTFILERSM